MKISNSVYNYLSVDVVPRKRSTTHKSSELKEVYNSMARYNKSSPLFLLSLSEKSQSNIINMKEAALTLRDVADSFSNTSSDIYAKKILHSSDVDSVSGSFRKSDSSGSLPDSLDIEIKSLATEQVNTGRYYQSNSTPIPSGNYQFGIETINGTSRFGVNVSPEDTALDIQEKIAGSINSRNIGIKASIIKEGDASSLMLSSEETGQPKTEDGLHFSFLHPEKGVDLVERFDLEHISTYPSNSEFSINGGLHSSSSNQISINQAIELDFHKPTTKPVSINFVPDTKIAMEQVDLFVDSYNNLVSLSKSEDHSRLGSRDLFRDISGIVNRHQGQLAAAGLSINEDNFLVKDPTKVKQGLENGEFASLFSDISSFKGEVEKSTTRLTIDPIAYVNKLMVTYPNTNSKLGASYTQSLYSGLIYNNYA